MRSIRVPLDAAVKQSWPDASTTPWPSPGSRGARCLGQAGWSSLQPPDSAWLNDQSVKGF